MSSEDKQYFWGYDIDNGFIYQMASEGVACHNAENNDHLIVFTAELYAWDEYPRVEGTKTLLGPGVELEGPVVTVNGHRFESYPRPGLGDLILIGPEVFTDGNVISWKGANFYRACGQHVAKMRDGATSCVKNVGHRSNQHEDMEGNTRYA